ncbi:transposase [Evansella sp. AB-P1]|uniref:transposase n=1 Tax=Evansella sp. AB-P1 TaxID=3037653 RepID=UPI00241E0CB8|nr:transposase [Evansella sp. AB-P1]MDG5789318.1 transposase [Evansella sp. AB-P1]
MSRKLRVWYPGASFHIYARGNRRTALFESREDYLMYLSILEDVRNMYPFILHSYCLMTNHIHLQLQTTTFHTKHIMKDLHGRYAVYFNRKYNLVGHLFQGRYGSEIIETDAYFLEVSRYIHLNPLEAKMVVRPQDYPWSSYPSYLFSTNNPHVTTTKVLSYFQNPKQHQYQLFVEGRNKQILEELKNVHKSE